MGTDADDPSQVGASPTTVQTGEQPSELFPETVIAEATETLLQTLEEPLPEAEESLPDPEYDVRLEVLSVLSVPLERVASLAQAFETTGLDPAQPTWVADMASTWVILLNPATGQPVKSPVELGYRQVDRPWHGLMVQGLAWLAHWLLRFPRNEATLTLPNGHQVGLHPKFWLGPAGEPVRLFQIRRMPDKTWVIQKSSLSQTTLPFADKHALRHALQQQMDQLEVAGKTRDIPGGQGFPVTTGSPFATPPDSTAPAPKTLFSRQA